jgi:ABC-type transporter Mla subunit MlaD
MQLRIQYFTPLICLLVVSCHRNEQRLILVELERADRIQKGAEMRYSGVVTGHVESITLTESDKLPIAKVVLAPDSPPLTAADEFRISASALLGDMFIEVIPATIPGVPLPNAAKVHAQAPRVLHLDNTGQIAKMLGNLNLVAGLLDLPEPKRAEVLDKIRKLLDDAKKEPTNK